MFSPCRRQPRETAAIGVPQIEPAVPVPAMTPALAPDPLPLREVLRGLRHGLRRGRRLLGDVTLPHAVPAGAVLMARPLRDGLDLVAAAVDSAGTDLARRLLGDRVRGRPSFDVLLASSSRGGDFAATVYDALRAALNRIGAGDAFVSEFAARRAHAAALGATPVASPDMAAAILILALVERGAVRDVATGTAPRLPGGQVAPVAATAVVLWLLADCKTGESGAALAAATDIAVALADEIVAAIAARDRARLAGLLREFATHV